MMHQKLDKKKEAGKTSSLKDERQETSESVPVFQVQEQAV